MREPPPQNLDAALFSAGLRILATAVIVSAVLYAAYVLVEDQLTVLVASFCLVEALHAPVQSLRRKMAGAAQALETRQAPARELLAPLLRVVKGRDWRAVAAGLRHAIVEHSIITFIVVSLVYLRPASVVTLLFVVAPVALLVSIQIQLQMRGRTFCGTRLDVKLLRWFASAGGSALLVMTLLFVTSLTLVSVLAVPAAADAYNLCVDTVDSTQTLIESDSAASHLRQALDWGHSAIQQSVTDEVRPLWTAVDKHGLKSEATARAGYAFIEGNFNETEWWPVIHGAHARYSAKKPKKAIIFGVRNDVERVMGHRPIWSVVRPYVDAIAIPLALSSIGAESDDHAVGSGVFQLATSHIGSLFPSAAAFTSFFLRGAVQLVSGALFPVIFAFSLAFYVYTLLTSNSRVLDRIVRALHPGTTAQHEALTKSIQNLVYRSMYLPVCYSCAMGTTTLMVLYLFSWIAPVSYISIAVLFVFIVTLFPVLGIPGYILVTLPWVLGAAVNGGFSFIVSIAMLFVVPLSLWFTQQQFFKHTVHDENALNLLAMLMGLYVFGLWGVIAGPFLAGAVLLLFQIFTPTRHVHASSDEKESMA